MNILFSKTIEKLKNCPIINNNEEREKFENEINALIEESIKQYNDISKEYEKANKKYLELDPYKMKSIVQELKLPTDEVYDEDNYPYYKYFTMTTYPNETEFMELLKGVKNYQIKYPLINKYIQKRNKGLRLLKYLPEFNEFENYMIDTFSYKLTRDEASKIKIKDLSIYKNNTDDIREEKTPFAKSFKKFANIWNNELKDYAIKFGCRDEMEPLTLDENQKVCNLLNDNGEVKKGMYIAAAYSNFISWQNEFIEHIINTCSQGGILHHYITLLQKQINVMDAKKHDVISLDFENQDYMNFKHLIYNFSSRNIILDNKINYKNYKQYIYNFDKIEEELGKILLTGKKLFFDEDKLRFVTFCYEGFRGNKSSVLVTFKDKYPTKVYERQEKQELFDYVSSKNKKQDLTKIMFSIQLLIYYLTIEKVDTNKTIYEIIKSDEFNNNVKISPECIQFFEDHLKLTLDKLYETYNYIELLCYQSIIDNLLDQYKKEIDEDTKQKILEAFNNNLFNLIKKIDLAGACRKYISRYLVSTRNDTDVSENNKLSLYLEKEELWKEEYLDEKAKPNEKSNNEKLKEDLNNFSKFDITVGEASSLYTLLGGDKDLLLEGVNTENKEERENEDNEDNDNYDENNFRIKKIKKK